MSAHLQRICGECGKPATGYASIWTNEVGDVAFCHGDDDTTPTCYEQAQAARSEPFPAGMDAFIEAFNTDKKELP